MSPSSLIEAARAHLPPEWRLVLGEPDRVAERILHWVLGPGTYLALYTPYPDPTDMGFYHRHPHSGTLHVIVGGAGDAYLREKRTSLEAGMQIFVPPDEPHCFRPAPNEPLAYVQVSHPIPSYAQGNWLLAPEAGIVGAFGDPAAFADRYGSASQLAKSIGHTVAVSERWNAFTGHLGDD